MDSAVLILALGLLTSQGAAYPPVTHFGPTNSYGVELQRSMRMLAESRVENKRTVKVHFYGQSITAAYWTVQLENFLKQKYPNARILTTNLALSGFTADLLVKTAVADLIPHYPDLLIFQDYGSPTDYEKIIAEVRRRTTADILIQSDHPIVDADLTEPMSPDAITDTWNDAWRNYIFLPRVAAEYGAELGDVRTYWKEYLHENNLRPQDLLSDNIHPNGHGEFLMRELVQSHLRVDPTLSAESWRDAVQDITINPSLIETNGVLTIPFVGNRVDLIVSRNGTRPIEVRIDGKRPSEFPEVYAFSRTAIYPGLIWPTILQVNSRAPLLEESWTATVLESRTNGTAHIRFAVEGSKTGFDGVGESTNIFVSNSGRVIIQPSDWLVLWFASWFYPAVQPLSVGHEIRWESIGYAVDELVPRIPDPTSETVVTVAQGLANGPHTLTLRGIDLSAIDGVRVYNPLARTQPAWPTRLQIENVRIESGTLTVQILSAGRYVIEGASRADGEWQALTAPITDRTFAMPVSAKCALLRLRKID